MIEKFSEMLNEGKKDIDIKSAKKIFDERIEVYLKNQEKFGLTMSDSEKDKLFKDIMKFMGSISIKFRDFVSFTLSEMTSKGVI